MVVYMSEMKELNNECCQDNCNYQATHKVYWPGQGCKKMCSEHTVQANRIAQAMGFHLHIESIEPVEPRTAAGSLD